MPPSGIFTLPSSSSSAVRLAPATLVFRLTTCPSSVVTDATAGRSALSSSADVPSPTVTLAPATVLALRFAERKVLEMRLSDPSASTEASRAVTLVSEPAPANFTVTASPFRSSAKARSASRSWETAAMTAYSVA